MTTTAAPYVQQFGHQLEWETSATGCCGNCNPTDTGVCMEGMFCPCVLYSQNKAAIDGKEKCGWGDCFCWAVLEMLCMGCCVAKNNRRKLRDMYGLKENGCCGCGDCCTHWCCPCCTLCQEAREINMRIKKKGASAGAAGATTAPGAQFMTATA